MMKKIKLLLAGFALFFLISGVALAEGTPQYSFRLDGTTTVHEVVPGDIVAGIVVIDLVDKLDSDFIMRFEPQTAFLNEQLGTGTAFDLSSWMYYPEGDQWHVEYGKPVRIPFRITIPEGLPPGDYNTVIKAVYIDPAQTGGSGARFTTSIAVFQKFSVPGERIHKVEFLDLIFESINDDVDENDVYRNGYKLISFDVEYKVIGNTYIRTYIDAEVTDMFGKKIREARMGTYDAFPSDTSRKVGLVLNEIPSFIGWADLKIKLSYSVLDIFGETSDEVFQVGEGFLRIYIIPWLALFLILIAIFLVVILFIYRNYRLNRLKRYSKVYIVVEGDTLQSVCSKFAVDSKEVISVNKMKSPYFLLVGSKILIPKKD